MKKLFMVIVIFLITITAAMAYDSEANYVSKSYNFKEGLQGKNYYFIDLSQDIADEYTVIRDNIVFINRTNEQGYIIHPYYLVAQTNQWVKGSNIAVLNGNGDKSNVKNKGLELKKIKCVAFTITPDYDYSFAVYAKKHDLYIEIGK